MHRTSLASGDVALAIEDDVVELGVQAAPEFGARGPVVIDRLRSLTRTTSVAGKVCSWSSTACTTSSSPTRASAFTPALASAATVATRFLCAASRAGSMSEAQRSRKPIRAGARTSTSTSPAAGSRRAAREISAIALGSSTAKVGTSSRWRPSSSAGRRLDRPAGQLARRDHDDHRDHDRADGEAGPASDFAEDRAEGEAAEIGSVIAATIRGIFQAVIPGRLSAQGSTRPEPEPGAGRGEGCLSP